MGRGAGVLARSVALAVLATTLLPTPGALPGPLYNATPGPPFDGWNVQVEPDPQNPRVLTLSFDSAILGLRAVNLVYVPEAYDPRGEPLPTVYFLHGTAGGSDSAARQVTGGPGAGSGAVQQIKNLRFETTLDRQRFLIVAPDAHPQSVWCGTCLWIDGQGPGAILAESHLFRELIPLVEAVFNVRTDRGGRGIMGNSMGASGALIQAFRHPDRFRAAVAFSPALDLLDHPGAAAFITAVGYLRGQGYGDAVTGEIFYRNVNPPELAPQVLGSGLEVLVVIGDGCLTTYGEGTCAERPPQSAAGNAAIEAFGRVIDDAAAARLTELGLPFTYVRREGIHGGHYEDTYKRLFLDRLNRAFREPAPLPQRFSYKTVDRRFSIWGYDVEVERPNNEFLSLLGARTDGREFTVAGTGEAAVRTPPVFLPGATYRVLVTPDGAGPTETELTADGQGRLALRLVLGPPRTVDERRALIDQGQFTFPHTRVEVIEP